MQMRAWEKEKLGKRKERERYCEEKAWRIICDQYRLEAMLISSLFEIQLYHQGNEPNRSLISDSTSTLAATDDGISLAYGTKDNALSFRGGKEVRWTPVAEYRAKP